MLKGLYILDLAAYDLTYGPDERTAVAALVDVYHGPQPRAVVQQNPQVLRDAQVILSGAGCPRLDESLLDAAPNLQAVFFGKGSIRGLVTEAFWQRGIRITSAWAANAVPVAEYTVSQILFCLKRGWQHALAFKHERVQARTTDLPGAYGSRVGVVSLGMVGRTVCEKLKCFDLNVLAYDPYATSQTFRALNVEPCSLEDIFRHADVVTLHAPLLPETVGMVTGEHIASMKRNATLINTARGALICQDEMVDVLRRRPDLFAVLDVTEPEPVQPDSPLFDLPNVIVTPHIAGALGPEYRRMGRYMVEELKRFVHGEPLRYEITQRQMAILA
jgi:phosphoglycerate dehydrogenase-like enzyme